MKRAVKKPWPIREKRLRNLTRVSFYVTAMFTVLPIMISNLLLVFLMGFSQWYPVYLAIMFLVGPGGLPFLLTQLAKWGAIAGMLLLPAVFLLARFGRHYWPFWLYSVADKLWGLVWVIVSVLNPDGDVKGSYLLIFFGIYLAASALYLGLYGWLLLQKEPCEDGENVV